MGDKVDSGIGLSYRPASLCSLAGLYDNPMPESTMNQKLKIWLFIYYVGRGRVVRGGWLNLFMCGSGQWAYTGTLCRPLVNSITT
jgi:hypothetical protein